MDSAPLVDPVLTRFRAAVEDIYGARVERVVLYGSRARGEAQPESDYDIAVFLRDLSDRSAEMDRLAELSAVILYDSGELIHAMPYGAGSYADRTPLMAEIRADGIDL
jgi:predicted nucleotidyltransferase